MDARDLKVLMEKWDGVKECSVNDDWDETEWMYEPLGEN